MGGRAAAGRGRAPPRGRGVHGSLRAASPRATAASSAWTARYTPAPSAAARPTAKASSSRSTGGATFRRGEKHGRGRVALGGGAVFEGWYCRGKRDGRGVTTSPGGERLEARYVDDELRGPSRFFHRAPAPPARKARPPAPRPQLLSFEMRWQRESAPRTTTALAVAAPRPSARRRRRPPPRRTSCRARRSPRSCGPTIGRCACSPSRRALAGSSSGARRRAAARRRRRRPSCTRRCASTAARCGWAWRCRRGRRRGRCCGRQLRRPRTTMRTTGRRRRAARGLRCTRSRTDRMATAHDVVVGSEVRVAPLLEWEPRRSDKLTCTRVHTHVFADRVQR